jgi:hypothetical protein
MKKKNFFVGILLYLATQASAGIKTESIYAKVKSYDRDVIIVETQDKKRWKIPRNALDKKGNFESGQYYLFTIDSSLMTAVKP